MQNKLSIFLFVLSLAVPARGGVEIYPSSHFSSPGPGLDPVPPSDRYAVSVLQDGRAHGSFVHISHARTEGPGARFMEGRTVSWTGFSLTGTAEILVTAPGGKELPAGDVSVYPLRHEISATRTGEGVRFRIPGPGHYLVTFGENGFEHALAVFANPPETSRPVPGDAGVRVIGSGVVQDLFGKTGEAHTVHFPPGVYELGGENIVPVHVRRIHLAGGAVVYGSFHINHDNVTVDGRGILSGLHMAHKEDHMVETPSSVSGTVVEGITVADFPYFAVRLLGTDSAIRWVKTIGAWIYNCDGFVAWARSSMSDSFIMANDDAIKVYDSNVSVKDCVTWIMTNGAALQMGWSSLEAHDVHIDGLDVIAAHWRPESNSENNGVLNLRLARGGGKTQSRWVIENIRVDTPVLRIFDLRMRSPKEPGGNEHKVKDFLIRNVTARMMRIEDNPHNYNFITPMNAEYGFENIVFENLVINGKTITAENAATCGRFAIDPASEDEIHFVTTLGTNP